MYSLEKCLSRLFVHFVIGFFFLLSLMNSLYVLWILAHYQMYDLQILSLILFVRCVFHSLNGFLCFTEGLKFVTVLLLSVFSFAVIFNKSSAFQHHVLPLFSSRRLTVSCPVVRSLIYLELIFVCNMWGGGPSFFCCLWVSGFPSTICWRHYPVPIVQPSHPYQRLCDTVCVHLSLYQHHTVFHFIFWNSFLVKVTFIFSLLYYCYTGKNLYFLFRRNVSISHFLALFTALI